MMADREQRMERENVESIDIITCGGATMIKIKRRIEHMIGCSIEDMILALKSNIRVGKHTCHSETEYSVNISNWDAEHLLMILRYLEKHE